MKIKEITGVSESPMTIDDLDFKFSDRKFNQTKAKLVLDNQDKIVIYETDFITVFRIGDDQTGELIGIPKDATKIDYYVNYKVYDFEPIGKAVAQVKLWRADIGSAVGMTSIIFFDYLLPEFGTIISDNQQTKDGESFWKSRLSEAYMKGLKIGILNTKQQKVDWFDKSVHISDWIEDSDGWGIDDEFMSKRYVIAEEN